MTLRYIIWKQRLAMGCLAAAIALGGAEASGQKTVPGAPAAEKFLPSDPMVPAKPAEVLPALPPAPQYWKLTKSEAAMFYNDWVSTIASRDYLEVPPPPKPGETPKPPGITRIRVVDTGYWPPQNAAFENFKPGVDGNVERTMFYGCPVMHIHRDDDGSNPQNYIIWVRKRFLVNIDLLYQKDTAGEQWARLLNYDILKRLPDTGEKKLPWPLQMIVFDELTPANSHTYRFFWNRIDN